MHRTAEAEPVPDLVRECRSECLWIRFGAGCGCDVDANTWTNFREAGYTHEQALEVVYGIGVYTMTTLANRLTETSE